MYHQTTLIDRLLRVDKSNIVLVTFGRHSEEDGSALVHILSLHNQHVIPGTENHPMVSVPHFLKVLVEQKGPTMINLKLYGQFCVIFFIQFISQPPPAHLGHSNEGLCVAPRVQADMESFPPSVLRES